MFTCMCASEDCAVNGCARLREIIRRGQQQEPPHWSEGLPPVRRLPVPVFPVPLPPAVSPQQGWLCTQCGRSNSPAVLTCPCFSPALPNKEV